MKPGFDEEVAHDLDRLREQDLFRELRCIEAPQSPSVRMEGRTFLNFSSNDYLGLANEPLLKEAAIKAVERFGAGSGASRLISGSLAPHHELEETIARFKGTEAALSFSSGSATALGVIGALLDSSDVIIIDRLVHASIIDAARLSGAKLRVFAHNDLDDLEKILRWADRRVAPNLLSRTPRTTDAGQIPSAPRRPRTLIVTESLFSMDGDFASLREIVNLKERFGAWLMVDEAHATGIYGPHRRGLTEAFEIRDQVDIQMGTLGKAVGASGGFIAGSRKLIDLLVNRARTFIFSTAPVPAAAAAAQAGICLIESTNGAERRERLFDLIGQTEAACSPLKRKTSPWPSPILPLQIGKEADAVKSSLALREQGIFVPAIRYPTVARGSARLRITMTAAHNSDHIARLANALANLELRFNQLH